MKLAAVVSYTLRRFYTETLAQDLIEYALMAGFVATTAGATMPGVATTISTIMSKIESVMTDSANTHHQHNG